VSKTQEVLLYISPDDDIVHIVIQLQPNERVEKMITLVLMI